LRTEVRYVGGLPWSAGDPVEGSVRLDVVEGPIDNPTWVWDYKSGNARLDDTRINDIRSVAGFGPNLPIHEVKPNDVPASADEETARRSGEVLWNGIPRVEDRWRGSSRSHARTHTSTDRL
jgi:hypothetical protein